MLHQKLELVELDKITHHATGYTSPVPLREGKKKKSSLCRGPHARTSAHVGSTSASSKPLPTASTTFISMVRQQLRLVTLQRR